ncbi:MAG: DUF309 domain-containing protein [Nitrospirota bacterium]|nr:DUF309 domain-containing protein [Nitrospirota bacterium]
MSQAQMGFDMGSALSGIVIHAIEMPEKAASIGWLTAFLCRDGQPIPLADLSREWQRLPSALHGDGRGPDCLFGELPVFAVALNGGELLTELRELQGVDWNSPHHRLTLFDGVRGHIPYLKERCARYREILVEWARTDPPPSGLPRVCWQYASLYNAGLYLEAYKLLELRWMTEEGAPRELLRGLMQLAVGLHQVQSGKYAVEQLEEAFFRIRDHAAAFPGPSVGRFVKRLEKATRLFKGYGPTGFRGFDLRLFPRLWMVSPWRALLGGRR